MTSLYDYHLARTHKNWATSDPKEAALAAFYESMDPVQRLMMDPSYAKEVAARSTTCNVCMDLDLHGYPMATLTTTIIDGKTITRREATVEPTGAGEWSRRHIKNCGFCALIADAVTSFFPDFFWGGWQLPRVAAITMVQDEPILVTVEDQVEDGENPGRVKIERFGVEIYRDSATAVPKSLEYVGTAAPPPTVDGFKSIVWPHRRTQSTTETAEQRSVKFIKSCVHDCLTNHTKCKKMHAIDIISPRKPPTHIVDLNAFVTRVSPSSPASSSLPFLAAAQSRIVETADVRLIHTSDLPASESSKIQYAALSHSWGGDIPSRLEVARLASYTRRISFSSLPATHRDAIVVARRLGYRYIWIDSLCIIQDDADDPPRETRKMGDIYTNAHLTIAAVSSGASSVSFLDPLEDETYTKPVAVKFFGARLGLGARDVLGFSGFRRTALAPALELVTSPSSRFSRGGGGSSSSRGGAAITLYARRTLRTAQRQTGTGNSASWNAPRGISDAVQGPLSKRAWTLQERALASRIVHFTAEGVRFECPSVFLVQGDAFSSSSSPSSSPQTLTPGYCAQWCELDSQMAKISSVYFQATISRLGVRTSLHSVAHTSITSDATRLSRAAAAQAEPMTALRDNIQSFWRTMLRDYSTRGITNRTDILPALSGVAARLQGLLVQMDRRDLSRQHSTRSSGSRSYDLTVGLEVLTLRQRDREDEDEDERQWQNTPAAKAYAELLAFSAASRGGSSGGGRKRRTAVAASSSTRLSLTLQPKPGQYLAGLWADRFIEDLCWTTRDCKWNNSPAILADEATLPSWSWASINHPTVYPVAHTGTQRGEGGRFIEKATFVKGETCVPTSQWNEFGHVASGEVVLRGPVRKGMLRYAAPGGGGKIGNISRVDFGGGATTELETDARLFCDDYSDNNDIREEEEGGQKEDKHWRRALEGEDQACMRAPVWCVHLGTWSVSSDMANAQVLSGLDLEFIMVLGRSARVPGAFQRLGFLEKVYGGKVFENVGDSIRREDEMDELLASLAAQGLGSGPVRRTAEHQRMWEEKRAEYIYPRAEVRELRII